MQFLLLSFLALAMGPLLVALARRHAFTTVAVDAFCVLTISGFALLHVLPESAEQAGWLVLPLALVGFIAPALAERGLQRDSAGLRRIVLVLALLGMAAHDTLDGLGLAIGAGRGGGSGVHPDGEVLAYAVILHRIPEGVGIWWILPRTLGTRAAVLVTAVTVVATVIGFWLGYDLLAGSTRSLAMLQALLAGSLLHVVLHAHVPAPREQTRWHVASFAGAAAALAVLWFVVRDHFPPGDEHGGPGQVFLHLAIESAPALLLAYALVGLCHEFLPATWLQQLTRGSTLTQALRGVAIGLPLPACSCGVVPLYRELVQKGVPLSAALAFLVATPELDVAALLLTWRLMGGEIALVRIGMAALLALSIGVVVGSLRSKPQPAAVVPADAAAPPPPASPGRRLLAALRFGFGPAVDNTASWILVGLLLSAMLMPYVQHDWIASLPAGIDVPIAALLGLPLYVCATGSTPFAAMLLGVGMSPGAVLAFMLMGPATNVTTIGVLARLNGGRIAFWFAACMWGGTVALGFAANWCLSAATPTLLQGSAHDHGTFAWVLLFALAGVFLVALLRQGVRAFLDRLFESPANTPHEHDHAMAPGCCAEPVACATGPVHAHGHDHDHDHHRDHGHRH